MNTSQHTDIICDVMLRLQPISSSHFSADKWHNVYHRQHDPPHGDGCLPQTHWQCDRQPCRKGAYRSAVLSTWSPRRIRTRVTRVGVSPP